MSAINQIAELLHRRCGFAVTESSLAALRCAVDRRMEETGIPSLQEYEPFLAQSAPELSELVEATIVSETFFFRYPESFAALRKWVVEHSVRRPLRILSLACATGEEPYSIAMSLLDEGLTAKEFIIEAVDISAQAVRNAERGVYGGKSFRAKDVDAWRERYFIQAGSKWEVRERLREAVNFRQANLLDLHDIEAWDVIFCRNVLIYFSGIQRSKVVHSLDRALAGEGLLFLGPAEPSAFLDHGWKLAGYPMSFACVRAGQISHPVRTQRTPEVRREPARRATVKPVAVQTSLAREVTATEVPSLVERARFLANTGALDEADTVLTDLLREEPENVEGHFLSGLTEEVRGHLDSAEASYRKALFLDPRHVEALQHMTLLLRNQGRAGAAEHLTRRVNRHLASS